MIEADLRCGYRSLLKELGSGVSRRDAAVAGGRGGGRRVEDAPSKREIGQFEAALKVDGFRVVGCRGRRAREGCGTWSSIRIDAGLRFP